MRPHENQQSHSYEKLLVMIGIMGAMEQEVAAIVTQMQTDRVVELGGRKFHVGQLEGKNVVVVVSRIGKVAAATTATILLERFAVTKVLFTGLAGAVAHDLQVGDIVIADTLLHHDIDARPLFSRYEIPLLGLADLPTDKELSDTLWDSAHAFSAAVPTAVLELAITTPKVHRGLVISGDQFISSSEGTNALRREHPRALAVEMEGAAVAQVCYEHGIPFAIVRVISDNANHSAAVDFERFLTRACGSYAWTLVRGALQRIAA